MEERPKRTGPWWDWSDVKRAIEFLFWSGQVTSARRRGFERLYDVPERVLPAEVIATPTPSVEEAQRELLQGRGALDGRGERARPARLLPAARRPEAKARIAELVEAGELLPGDGRRLAQPRLPRPRRARSRGAVDACAVLGPFDSLIWERDRVERLFGFRYRIEIYVPAEKRVHGYYVLPFLLGDRLVARVDLKADRQAGVLRVQAAHAEEGAPPETAERAPRAARGDGRLARPRARPRGRRPRRPRALTLRDAPVPWLSATRCRGSDPCPLVVGAPRCRGV